MAKEYSLNPADLSINAILDVSPRRLFGIARQVVLNASGVRSRRLEGQLAELTKQVAKLAEK